MSNKLNYNLLLIESRKEDIDFLEQLLITLSRTDHYSLKLDVVKNIEKAVEKLNEGNFDVVMVGVNVDEDIQQINDLSMSNSELPIIILSHINSHALAIKAIQSGAQDYLIKSKITEDLLIKTVRVSIERHKMMHMLKGLALLDELTGLYNRQGFIKLADHHVKLAKRKKNKVIVVYIDVDYMNYINENYGLSEGDQAIKDTSTILIKCFRESDIIARIGSDKFIVLAFDTKTADDNLIVNRLENNLKIFNDFKDKEYELSFSFEISHWDEQNMVSVGNILENADKSMYIYKKNKRKQG